MPLRRTTRKSKSKVKRKSRRQCGGLFGMSSTLNKFSKLNPLTQGGMLHVLKDRKLFTPEDIQIRGFNTYIYGDDLDGLFKKAYYSKTPEERAKIKAYISEKYTLGTPNIEGSGKIYLNPTSIK